MNNDQSTGMSWLAVLFIIIVIAALFGGFGNGFGFGRGNMPYPVNITGAGYYDVDASVTVAPTAAGTVTATLYKDGVAVPGATASAAGAAGAPVVLAFPALVRQVCCAAGSALTLVLTGAAATVNNVALRVQRI